MTCSSSCARSNPARPLLGLLVWLLAFGVPPPLPGLVRAPNRQRCTAGAPAACAFRRGPFDVLLATMAALSCFAVAIGPLRFSERPSQSTYSAQLCERGAVIFGSHRVGLATARRRLSRSHRHVSQCLLLGVNRSSVLRCGNFRNWTLSRQKPDRNSALQRAPNLISPIRYSVKGLPR